MARRSTGGVVERETSRGTSFAIRFRVGGQRVFQSVGYSQDGVTRADAERELRYTLEQVRRGEWRPPAEIEPPRSIPTFTSSRPSGVRGAIRPGCGPRRLSICGGA